MGWTTRMSPISLAPSIDQALQRLGLPRDAFVQLGPDEAEDLLHRILTRFAGGVRPGFWWERLVGPEESWHVPDGRSLDHLQQVVPDDLAAVWVVTFCADPPEVFATTASAIAKVFAECHAFEYFFVPRDMSWLVGENHHEFLIAVGEPVASRLRLLAS